MHPDTRLALEKLERRASPKEVVDVFAIRSWYTPPPPPPPLPPPVVIAPEPPPAPVVPSLPFTYIGKFQEESGRLVIYLAQGDKVHSVGVGDAVENSYKVDSIEGGIMTLTYLPLNIKQTLSLGDMP